MAEQETGSGRVFVIGYPISHSRSPLIHRHWLERMGLRGSYDPVPVGPGELPAFIRALKDGTAGFAGGNVTIPHKEAVLSLVDAVDETARQIGAVNTLWLENGRLKAINTDSYGFSANLDERCPDWSDRSTAVVLGAGGASRAVIHAILSRGYDRVYIVNRSLGRAQELAGRFGDRCSAHAAVELDTVLRGADLFVNTTSLGMDGGPAPEIDFTVMAKSALVTDIVYVPLQTPFLAMASRQGLATVDGLGMLLHQAAPGFEKWFGIKPQVTQELRDLVIADMEAH